MADSIGHKTVRPLQQNSDWIDDLNHIFGEEGPEGPINLSNAGKIPSGKAMKVIQSPYLYYFYMSPLLKLFLFSGQVDNHRVVPENTPLPAPALASAAAVASSKPCMADTPPLQHGAKANGLEDVC